MTQERRRAAPSEKDHGVEPVGAGSCRPDTSAITANPDHLEPAPTGTVGETEIWPNRPGAPPGHWKREGTIEEPSARARRHAGTCRAAAGRSRTHPRARRHGVDYSRAGDAGLSRKGTSVHHRPPEESHYFAPERISTLSTFSSSILSNPRKEKNMPIVIDSVNKSYGEGEGTAHVLKDVSCTIEDSEICVIIGASGSGKSTLLNCLGGLDRPDSGTIEVNRQDIASLHPKDLTRFRRKQIGFVFQFYNLVPNLTVRENIEVCEYLTSNPLPLRSLIDSLGLTAHQDKSPRNCPEGSSNDAPSHAHSSSARASSCATSPRGRWTTRPPRRCSNCSSGSTGSTESQLSSCPTTRPSRPWPTVPSPFAMVESEAYRCRTPRRPPPP